MMRVGRVAVAAGALILGCIMQTAPLKGSEPLPWRGRTRISFSGSLIDTLQLGTNAWIRFWARNGVEAKLRVAVKLPPGLTLVEGDTARIIEGHSPVTWVITIRPDSLGTRMISGFAWTFETNEGTDELEWELPLTVNQSAPAIGTKNVREEQVKDGQRYRCAGYCLVPIDSSERITQSDIERRATRGRPLESTVVFDSSRSLREPQEARLVVVIDRDGHVIEASRSRFIPVQQLTAAIQAPRPDAAVQAAEEAATEEAMRAVRRWRFEPTRMFGRPISDWVEVTVQVEPLP